MSTLAIISLVSMVGWLVLMIGSYRSHQVPKGTTFRNAMIWIGVFLAVAFVAGMLTG